MQSLLLQAIDFVSTGLSPYLSPHTLRAKPKPRREAGLFKSVSHDETYYSPEATRAIDSPGHIREQREKPPS
jgi:hypothetical protein